MQNRIILKYSKELVRLWDTNSMKLRNIPLIFLSHNVLSIHQDEINSFHKMLMLTILQKENS